MKKWSVVVSMIFIMTLLLTAEEKVLFRDGESAIFKMNGNMTVKTIVDMSSRTGKIEFSDETSISRDSIWMINFLNKNWRWHKERECLSTDKDTVFLKNGNIIKGEIIDFSKPRKVFEFKNDSPIHVSKIKRIYFCCTPIPEPYKKIWATDKLDKKKSPYQKYKIQKKNRPKEENK